MSRTYALIWIPRLGSRFIYVAPLDNWEWSTVQEAVVHYPYLLLLNCLLNCTPFPIRLKQHFFHPDPFFLPQILQLSVFCLPMSSILPVTTGSIFHLFLVVF